MRAAIVTIGTEGDVAPFVGVGARLRDAGYQVTVVTHRVFAGSVERCGLDFSPLAGDPHAVVSSEAFRRWQRTGYSPRHIGRQVGLVRAVIGEVRALVEQAAESVAAAIPRDADILLLSATGMQLGYHVAEATRTPSMGIYWGPMDPTAEFPPIMTGARSFGAVGNRLAGHIGLRLLDGGYTRAARRLRASLGLAPVGLAELRRRLASQDWPVHHGYSPTVLSRPRDWRPGLHVDGYWWAPRPAGWQPPPDLADFVQAGPPPVYVGFGSTSPADADRLSELVTSALAAARVRGVVQAGWAALAARTDDVITIGSVPHDWLFPRMAALVHHCGTGTTGAGLRAGVPAVPVPVMADQAFWARRLEKLGIGPAPLPFHRLSADRLSAAIRTAVAERHHRDRAASVAQRLRGEDGAGRVLDAVNRIVGGDWTRSAPAT